MKKLVTLIALLTIFASYSKSQSTPCHSVPSEYVYIDLELTTVSVVILPHEKLYADNLYIAVVPLSEYSGGSIQQSPAIENLDEHNYVQVINSRTNNLTDTITQLFDWLEPDVYGIWIIKSCINDEQSTSGASTIYPYYVIELSDVSSINENVFNNVTFANSESVLTIKNANNLNMQISSIDGRIAKQVIIDSDIYQLYLPEQLYVIRLSSGNLVQTNKLYIK